MSIARAGGTVEHDRMDPKQGDVAVVTGAASGIGAALAADLGGRGLTVVLVDLDTPELAATHDALAATGASVRAAPVDVTDAGAVRSGSRCSARARPRRRSTTAPAGPSGWAGSRTSGPIRSPRPPTGCSPRA